MLVSSALPTCASTWRGPSAIEHFFQAYKDLEAKKVDTAGFGPRDDALEVIAAARAAANA